MATLVLTVVGGAIGGPLGAALGSALGQSIDRNLIFRPKGREGPRLSDLSVQTSTYGAAIPRLHGSLRVAGTVIWSTDLIETRGSQSNGKGQPKTTTYSYSASFAVLLSARRIGAVRRIWADGKLLRGVAGDFKSQLGGFRLHPGDADQPVDPLIASAEGIDQCPAYRGLAYVVFEQLQLADFGNRIPSLTFEVEADVGPVSTAAILADAGGGRIEAEAGAQALTLSGYALQGRSVADAVGALADLSGWWFAPGDGIVIARAGAGAAIALADDGVRAAGERASVSGRSIEASDRTPHALSVAYYDPVRDYQAGLQRAWRPDGSAATEQVELPAAMTADSAMALAETLLARRERDRVTRRIAAGWAALDLAPGDRVTVAGEAGLWRISGWSLESMRVSLELKPVGESSVPLTGVSDSGRAMTAPDAVIGRSHVEAFELPALDDSLLGAPRLLMAVSSVSPGWRSAALSFTINDSGRSEAAGLAEVPAVMGSAENALPPGSAALEDRRSVLDIILLNDSMLLADADAAAMDAGANLALLGDELIQFAQAQALGSGRWRLSGLWRGRRGTEWAAASHLAGERFVLLESDAVVARDLALSAVGGTVEVEALGVGDIDGPATAVVAIGGDSIVPPAPVGLRVGWPGGGTVSLSWTRRSRLGWAWRDGGDAPLGEEAEHYALRLSDQAGWAFATETEMPTATVPVDGALAWPVQVEIRQQGALGLSRPLSVTLNSYGEMLT